ncbi:MAG: O-antigen ligase family protein [Candidatus Omnitrophota bacterium]|nr:O-antigen ligase family protein [Candidatus Omnitrophota bacterium]MDZ4242140.1 O-antigen ligase family protein [Candidatus Omnitrophota bacterium]
MTQQKALDRCDLVMRWAFCSLIFFVPISTALVESFFGLILLTFFIKRGVVIIPEINAQIRRGVSPFSLERWKAYADFFRPSPSFLNVPIGVFLLINFLSVLFSPYPLLSLRGVIFKLFENIYLYFAFVECMTARRAINAFLTVFVGSAMLIGASGVTQFVTGRDFIYGNLLGGGRVMASFKHPNDYGSYLLIAIFVLLGLVMASFSRRGAEPRGQLDRVLFHNRALLLLILVVNIACLGFTFSRGAWVGFSAAVFLLILLDRRGGIASLIILCLFFMVFTPLLVKNRNVSFTSDDVRWTESQELQKKELESQSAPSPGPETAVSSSLKESVGEVIERIKNFTGCGRTDNFWAGAFHVIRKYPVFGSGYNTYQKVIESDHKIPQAYPHNCYLQMAAETGVIGLAAFLWVIGLLIVKSLAALPLIRDPHVSGTLGGLLAGLGGFFTHAAFDTNFYSVQLGSLMWVMMGLAVALRSAGLADSRPGAGAGERQAG